VVLLGVAATHFPGTTLHLNREEGTFREEQANSLLDTGYRSF